MKFIYKLDQTLKKPSEKERMFISIYSAPVINWELYDTVFM